MSSQKFNIVFYDNAAHYLLKTIDILKAEDYSVELLSVEEEFLSHLHESVSNVVLINLDVQPNDGITLINHIKQEMVDINPFIILYTKKQDEFAHELAYNSGADAVINFYDKPILMKWFIKNLLRRKISSPLKTKNNLEIDNEEYLIVFKNNKIQLPKKEFLIFKLLIDAPEKFHTKKEIAQLIWNDETISTKRNIDVHIYNIRKLIKRDVIQSQKNKGYRINKKLLH